MNSDYNRFMERVIQHAKTSTDPSTQNAAALVKPAVFHELLLPQTLVVNGFPRGVVNVPERWQRPQKYDFVEHAERNAIYTASRLGIATQGLTMVAVWASCADCARAIIQAGIKTLVRYVSDSHHSHWAESINSGDVMFAEAGVRIVEIDKPFPNYVLRRNGEVWRPMPPQN